MLRKGLAGLESRAHGMKAAKVVQVRPKMCGSPVPRCAFNVGGNSRHTISTGAGNNFDNIRSQNASPGCLGPNIACMQPLCTEAPYKCRVQYAAFNAGTNMMDSHQGTF